MRTIKIEEKLTFFRVYLNQMDLVEWLSVLLILAFGLTMFTAYHFPLYSDEVDIRFLHSRIIYDFPLKLSGTPRCISTYAQPMPWSMYWPGLINWGIHGNIESPTLMRQFGVAIAFLWILGLFYYLSRKTKKPLSTVGFVISLFSIGVLPIFLVLNRSEQLLVPSVVLLIITFLSSDHLTSKTWQKKIGLIALYFTAVSLIVFGHAKGLFLIPLFLVVGWKLFGQFKSRVPLIAASVFLTIQIVQSYSVWRFGYICNEFPDFERLLKSTSFNPFSLFSNHRLFFEQAVQSLSQFPHYLYQLGFQEYSDNQHLPTKVLDAPAQIVNLLIKINAALAFFGLMIFLFYQYRREFIMGRFFTSNFALLILFVCVFIAAFFNLTKIWYDAGYVYSLLLVTIIFSIGENFPNFIQNKKWRLALIYLGVLSLSSQIVFAYRNLPEFKAGFAGPGIPIGFYETEKIHDHVRAALSACDIDPIMSRGLVVDNFTYGFTRKTNLPMAITYIWEDSNLPAVKLLFSKIKSDGWVLYCPSVPKILQEIVKKSDNICCLSKKQVNEFFRKD